MSEEIQWDQLIGLTGEHGEKYLGFIPIRLAQGPVQIKSYMEKCRKENLWVELEGARFLINQLNAMTSPTGELAGLTSFTLLIPMDVRKKAAPIFINPSAWYYPADDEDTKKAVAGLFEAAARQESIMAANSAGLHIPGIPTIVGGRRS